MEIKQNWVYAIPRLKTVARVMEIDGDNIKFNTGITVNKDDVCPLLPVGTILNDANGNSFTVKSELESCFNHENSLCETDERFISFIDSYERPAYSIIKYPEAVLTHVADEMENMVTNFFKSTIYSTTPLAINKILSTWKNSKERLRTILSKHPLWNEDELAIDWEIEVPNKEQRDLAKSRYCTIVAQYREEYRNDYDRLMPLLEQVGFNSFIEGSEIFKLFGLHIAKGMKPTRALRKFFDETMMSRVENFEKMFAELADALSTKPLKRRITLSIHPMDFLRMSYGNSWSSCHHIGKRGCYSNGTLSYLMDEQAMVVSLLDPNSKDKTYEQPKINRMMFFLNESNDVLQSRLYPQVRIQELEDILAKEVAQKISECLNIEQTFKAVVSDVACDCYVTSAGTHYRDYACTNFGQRIWSTKDVPGKFKIGHDCYCVSCGEPNNRNGSLNCGCAGNEAWRVFVDFVCPNSGRRFYNIANSKYNPKDGRYYIKYSVCKECGEVFFDSHIYCEECRKKIPLFCEGTGELIEGIPVLIDGKTYSQEYVDDNFMLCPECGEYHPNEDMEEVDGVMYCRECVEENDVFFWCEDCQSYHHKDHTEYYYIEDYGYVCQDCYDEGDYCYCYHCEEYFQGRDLQYVDGHDVCENCLSRYYRYCDRCEEYHDEESGDWLSDGDTWWCEYCIENYATRCDHCGDYYPDNTGETVDEDANWCDECVANAAFCCPECEEYCSNDLGRYDEETGETYCQACYEQLIAEREQEEPQSEFVPYTATLHTAIDGFEEGRTVEVLAIDGERATIKINDGVHEHYRFVGTNVINAI